jgi:predicted secreted hydrolase
MTMHRRDGLKQLSQLAVQALALTPLASWAATPGGAQPGSATGVAPGQARQPESPRDAPRTGTSSVTLATIDPRRTLRFPRDFGAHPDARTEWWYLTGCLRPADAASASTSSTPGWGFQLTFFRSRTGLGASSRSAFAPQQLVLAHAALTDVRGGRLWHAQQVARAGFGVVHASEADTDVRLRQWSLQRGPGQVPTSPHGAPSSLYQGQVSTPDFKLSLQARSTQPVLLQGQQGHSRKGPQLAQASHYYSQPQLAVQATLQPPSASTGASPAPPLALTGLAWLDHEWSESVLDAQAVGWDWIGMNLDDGSSLMAFRIRDRQGRALWAGGGWRDAAGTTRALSPDEVRWTPLGETWPSPRTGARYPVAWQLDAAGQRWQVRALVPDQELDTRGSTGTAYWEGLSALHNAQGQRVGWGYLEMTGYAGALSL